MRATCLIEGLEPRQNRKGGDGFSAVEFLQVADPEVKREELLRSVHDLLKKF
jgi:hypothetical protein